MPRASAGKPAVTADDPTIPMKQIVDRRYYAPKHAAPGTGSVELTLECGHKIHRKRSDEPRYQCRCEPCYYDQSVS